MLAGQGDDAQLLEVKLFLTPNWLLCNP